MSQAKLAKSANAQKAIKIISELQNRFVVALEKASKTTETPVQFAKVDWLREGGKFGGGHRYVSGDNAIFNRAAVNYSHVQYEDDFDKPLNSATAISTIIHPDNPLAPSVHMHYSFTELKDGSGYWRVMADLNPAIANDTDRAKFVDAMQVAAGNTFDEGVMQGNKYFMIPVLDRTRGVAHFYLEGYRTKDQAADAQFVQKFGETMIDCYADILENALQSRTEITDEHKQQQLDYHTAYLFQVLTLDRGTTSGLLVHNENDVGILGSIPKNINRKLLETWVAKMPSPQEKLLQNIIDALPDSDIAVVSDFEKQALADVVRAHFTEYPESLNLQAKGDVVPPTVANHK